jgi:hypothetical protein
MYTDERSRAIFRNTWRMIMRLSFSLAALPAALAFALAAYSQTLPAGIQKVT